LQDSVEALKEDVLAGQRKLEVLLSSVVTSIASEKRSLQNQVEGVVLESEDRVHQTQTTLTSLVSHATTYNCRLNEEEACKWISVRMEGVTLKDVFFKWYAYKLYSFEPPVGNTKSTKREKWAK
jgi:hypothetical protein